MADKSGYHGQILYGSAGSTAGTLLTNVEDLNYDTEPEKVETTVRGNGSAVPIKVEDVVAIGAIITWAMFLKTGDTALTALIAAARAGAAVAIRTKSYASGLGFDGDCTLSVSHEKTLKGASKFNFTATPTDSAGRTPQLNV